jgi:hypothetical protein
MGNAVSIRNFIQLTTGKGGLSRDLITLLCNGNALTRNDQGLKLEPMKAGRK